MEATDRSGAIPNADAAVQIPGPMGEPAALALKRGQARLSPSPLLFRSTGKRRIKEDEPYVVIRAQGVMIHGDEQTAFAAVDTFFAAPGTEHPDADFSVDLALWRIFNRRLGGDGPPNASRGLISLSAPALRVWAFLQDAARPADRHCELSPCTALPPPPT